MRSSHCHTSLTYHDRPLPHGLFRAYTIIGFVAVMWYLIIPPIWATLTGKD